MIEWIHVNERLPTEAETFNGRVPVLNDDGELRYAMLVGQPGSEWLLSDLPVVYWCVPPRLP
jgi:hypothetical protein